MSRVTRKQEEETVAQALLRYLHFKARRINGYEMGDRPDLIFDMKGIRVGCEIASILPNRIRAAIAKGIKKLQRRGVRVVRTIIPFEPHTWVSEIIAIKNREYDEYVRIMNLKDGECLWLLLHAPLFSPFDIIDYNRDEVWSLMVRAATRTPSKYGNIFFCDQKGNVKPLKGVTPLPRAVEFCDLDQGYPTYVRYDYSSNWEDGLSEDNRHKFFLNVPAEDTIQVEPFAKEFFRKKPRLPWGNFAFELIIGDGQGRDATYTGVHFADLSHTLKFATKFGVRRQAAKLTGSAPVFIGAIITDKYGSKSATDVLQLPPS